MQSIIRSDSSSGTDPVTNSQADRSKVETAFVRVQLHSNFTQANLCLEDRYQKLIKHFFADCTISFGFSDQYKIQSSLQTVIILNCKFSSSSGFPNYNNSNPQIHIETIDESCREFTASEKAAGRSVTELTIKVLCEQLKLINIPETEKMELICSFVQRRNVQNEEVIQAMAVSGFDYSEFVQKKGITNDQVLIMLVKSGVDCSDFMQKKGMNNDQVLNILVKETVDISGFVEKKGINNEQIVNAMISSGLTIDQIMISLVKAKLDISTFVKSKELSDEEVLIILAKNGLNYIDFVQKKGITDEYSLIAFMKNNIDYKAFVESKYISDEQVLVALEKSGIDFQNFIEEQNISDDQVLIILTKNSVDVTAFAQKKGISSEHVLITLMKSGLDYSSFVQSNKIKNHKQQRSFLGLILRFLTSNSFCPNTQILNLNRRKQTELQSDASMNLQTSV
ncbi:Hypothetical_protein [Hexamita inflata]|uniref:Hypothetical_protein n=1 Tax=Hexamita inflata TaxID=28002 RepID=A0AA86Q7I7_9EUKA|nr:Hypothetical protein HINF_LOCUS35079 [Hexamita inflata]